MVKKKTKQKQPSGLIQSEIRVTPTQKRKAKRVALSSVITAMFVTFLFLLQIATVKISNSDFPIGNIVATSFSNAQHWKTFADNRFGFSFEYPAESVSVVDDTENAHAIIPTDYPEEIIDVPNEFFKSKGYDSPHSLYSIQVKNTDINAVPFSLWIFENRDMLSPDAWYEKYDYYPFAFAPHISAPVDPERPIQNVLLSGLLGKYHVRVSDSSGEVAYLYILRKKTMFLLVVNQPTDTGEVGNKILSTFRFFREETAR